MFHNVEQTGDQLPDDLTNVLQVLNRMYFVPIKMFIVLKLLDIDNLSV